MSLLNFKKGFTLAENLIVLSVLGIIMILVIPGMVNDKNRRNNQIAVRKAVTTYQNVLEQEFIKATGVRSTNDFDNILNDSNCEKIRAYLRTNNPNSCKFKSDNIEWDFTTPSKVIIALKGEKVTAANANNDNNLKVFYLTYSINKKRQISVLTDNDASKTRLFIIGD